MSSLIARTQPFRSMINISSEQIRQGFSPIVPNGPFTLTCMGFSFAYAVEKKKYIHLPIILFFPTIYTGYQVFKNRDSIFKEMDYVPSSTMPVSVSGGTGDRGADNLL